MGSVNVNRSVTDTFYRYKMPRLLAKVEGKGNGIKTVIVNMPDIAKALNRPPTYPTKYFGCELGAQTQVDNKNDRYIVNGDHDAGKLQDLLDGFIQRYVLCQECENPETDLTVRKNQIMQKCKACGHACTVALTHRLSTFILKNPPGSEPDPAAGGKPGKKDKRGKKSKGEDAKPETGDSAKPGEQGDEAGAGEEKNGSKEASEEDEDEDWAVDPDDAEQRKMEMSTAIASLTVNEDMEKPEDERLDMYCGFVEGLKKSGKVDGKALVTEAERLDIRDKAVLVISRCLLDEKVKDQVDQYRNVFLRFTMENPRAQRYLLYGVEQVILNHRDDLLVKTPLLLKAFYDADIVEEEAILDWGRKAPKKRLVSKEDGKEVRAKAEPFLTWLAEAEEETSDESEEEDANVEFAEEKSGAARAKPAAAAPVNGAVGGGAEDDDDLDIDDI